MTPLAASRPTSAHFLASRDEWDAAVAAFGREVADLVRCAVDAFVAGDAAAAREAIEAADGVAERGRRLDEDGLKVLALYRPVGLDLRALAAVQKAARALVGAGDLAAKVASAARGVADPAEAPHADLPAALGALSERARGMLEESVEALVRRDAGAARRVLGAREEAAALRAEALAGLEKEMGARADHVAALLGATLVVDALDRVSRRAAGIAEDVIYLLEETVVRRVG